MIPALIEDKEESKHNLRMTLLGKEHQAIFSKMPSQRQTMWLGFLDIKRFQISERGEKRKIKNTLIDLKPVHIRDSAEKGERMD